jgi:hypothetical protein
MTTPEPLPIPVEWEDVTPEWMTLALANRFPEAHVSDVGLIWNDSGSNRRARFRITYDRGSGPDVVFVKGEGTYREVHAKNGNMFNEPDLFASGAALLVDHPTPYHVIIDRPGLNYLIVMEDVTRRGGDPLDATRPVTVDQAAKGLRGLARLHSRYWDFSAAAYPELAWVQTFEASIPGLLDGLDRFAPAGLERVASQLSVDLSGYDAHELVVDCGRFVETLSSAPLTLLHGDTHVGNTYVLPDGDIGFLDWQVSRRANWSHDVGYFIVSALTVDDRRSSERELLDVYLAALDLPDAQRPTSEDAWLRYRASPAYGLPVWLATFGSGHSQADAICLALCDRYGSAFVDLDTRAALAGDAGRPV